MRVNIYIVNKINVYNNLYLFGRISVYELEMYSMF